MTIEIPKYKYVQDDQTIDLSTNKICTLIGGNGSGKSTILESIFANYNEKIISFSSGQNELFTKIYNNIKSSTFKKIQNIDTNLEEIKKYHFHYEYSRILVFVALSLKNGLVRKYLNENSYIDTLLSNTFLDIDFELPDYYLKVYAQARKKETMEPEYNSIIKTYIHKYIERIIENKINNEYDFDKAIKKRTIRLTANDLLSIVDKKDSWKIFTFISLTNNATTPIFDYKSTKLLIKNDLEFEQLSDGEYQLLSIYALIDLFDSEDTLFLFDEIDSHLHFNNINKMWDTLKNIRGKLISTTHISESILKNNFDSLLCVNNGKIEDTLTATEVFKRLSNVTGQKKYEYRVASKIKHIALLDDEVDWKIFKKLAIKKIGSEVIGVLDNVIPYKRSSGWNNSNDIFGQAKLKFVEEFKEQNTGFEINTKNIFLICDRDKFLLAQIDLSDLSVKIHKDYRELKSFENTKTYLHSWRMLEIENYLLSRTMLNYYGKFEDFKNQFARVNFDGITTFDESEDLRTYDAKAILHPLYKDGGFDEVKLDEVIDKIPTNEISEDIVKMYEFIKSKVEDN